jgi:hypothetical protein
VADMLGTTEPVDQDERMKRAVKTKKQPASKTAIPIVVYTALPREKTSFALRPAVKRHLTELKLDLRAAGHRVTEAEIVETLIAQANADALVTVLGAHARRPRRSA